jgi:hypothetical protein
MSNLHSQIPEFEKRNNFLWFVLGLHSLSSTIISELSPLPGAKTEKVTPAIVRGKKKEPGDSLLR